MDEIMIGIDFMKIGWVVAVPLIVTCIITYALNCKISEFTFALSLENIIHQLAIIFFY